MEVAFAPDSEVRIDEMAFSQLHERIYAGRKDGV